jgi:hypothetical protein
MGRPALDLTGQQFGRLTALERLPKLDIKDPIRWKCQCACGNELNLRVTDLRSGNFKSCGCFRSDRLKKHDKVHTRIYVIWGNMIQRCTNPKNKVYAAYGGRGITFQDSWKEFSCFYADMGEPPTNAHTLERRDTNGNYTLDNCRWATMDEQAANKRNNRTITHDGRTQILAQWAREIGIHHATIRNRLERGWSVQEALYGKGN